LAGIAAYLVPKAIMGGVVANAAVTSAAATSAVITSMVTTDVLPAAQSMIDVMPM